MSGAQPVAFGRYLLESKLASGGMGEIFLARARGAAGFEKRVVIKRVLPHLAESNEFVERFLDEGRLVVQLNHGNIVQVLDMGEVEGHYYLAMEYVDGMDLRALLQRIQRDGLVVPVTLAMHIVVEIAKGLSYAHNQVDDQGERLNVIHRDVSPSNVMVSRAGEVKLLDFGIAKATARMSQSVSGSLHGKFLYMSPEQAAARPLDHRSDLFSLGSLTYELLTGKRPFQGESELKTLDLIRAGVHQTVCEARPEVPPAVEALVERCLQIDPDKRFQSADELQRAILAWFVESRSVVSASDLAKFVKPYVSSPRPTQPLSLDDALQRQLDELLAGPSEAPRRPPTQLARRADSSVELDVRDPITGLNMVPDTSGATTGRAHLPDAADSSVGAASRNRIFLWSIGLLVFVLVALNIIMINTFGDKGETNSAPTALATPPVEPSTLPNPVPPGPAPAPVARPPQEPVDPPRRAPEPSRTAPAVVVRLVDHTVQRRERRSSAVMSAPAVVQTMRLTLSGLPVKARVQVNGQTVDLQRLRGDGYEVAGEGEVTVLVEARGYDPWRRTLARRPVLVELTPQLKKVRTKKVRLRADPSTATISVNGSVVGRGAADVVVASNVGRRVKVAAPGYETSFVVLKFKDDSRRVRLKAKSLGRFKIMVTPHSASVRLDGKAVPRSKSSSVIQRQVKPGKHTLRVEYEGRSKTVSFDVGPNETKQLRRINLSN